MTDSKLLGLGNYFLKVYNTPILRNIKKDI